MRVALVVLLVLLAGGARAQPAPSASPYAGPPGEAPRVPLPYAYAPASPPLTTEEQQLLERGYISADRRVIGVLAAIFVGWGSGQAVEGRWHETGRIFAIGELATTALVVAGFFDCLSHGAASSFLPACEPSDLDDVLLVGGTIGLAGFRIGEVADAAVGPSEDNDKLRALRVRLGQPVSRIAPYLAPVRGLRSNGGVAGLRMQF